MCTVVLLRRPGHAWPLLLAGNRDEMGDRPSRPPGRHWPDRPELRAGLDELSGGSWVGVNDWGVTAAVLNRYGTLGSDPAKRSRGELVLEALDHAEARAAAEALADLDPAAYRGFNLVVADARDAYWIKNPSDKETDRAMPAVMVRPVPEGVSMLSAFDLNDRRSPRIAHYLPRFEDAAAPDPGAGEWSAWQALLAERNGADGEEVAAMTFRLPSGFGTLSSSLVALPAPPPDLDVEPQPPEFLYADGPPDQAAYEPVAG